MPQDGEAFRRLLLGCKAEVNVMRLTPSVINNAAVTGIVREAVKSLPGLEIESGFRTMVSEDMAYMMEQLPGCYLLVGGGPRCR